VSEVPRLTHLDDRGEARMVGVGHKPPIARRAVAEGLVRMAPASARAMADGELPKGDAAAVARVAGIVRITAAVETTARTGVEMEALTAVSVAALNVYDLVKGIDKGIVIESVRLLEKTKGEPAA
jgi:cyclic pyranopterin monophosphate synthase